MSTKPVAAAPVPSPDAYTLGQSGMGALLKTVQAEHARLGAIVDTLAAVYAAHRDTDLVACSPEQESAILTPFYQSYDLAALPNGQTDIYRLLQRRVADERGTVQDTISRKRDRLAAQSQREQAAKDAEEAQYQAERAEVERLQRLMAKHGQPPL